ncbi:molybdopterin molybdotransferase MoeA [Crocinitomicaceae bacterium]|nr:molybdopterin molybdotransferase MoeA [Crocinitomicaceae bacterium]
MISANKAIERILETTSTLETIEIPLPKALGHTLSEDALSSIDMPPFDNSAMDGYAINAWESNTYTVVSEIRAGANATDILLNPGEAARIFTGAMVPESCTAVVKQEITTRNGNSVAITEAFKSGGNIRKRAEQIETGAIALTTGTFLNAAAIGFLQMLGITSVKVYRKPTIKLLITGDELVAAGKTLEPGQIYESNGITIISALRELGFDAASVRVNDDYQSTVAKVKELLLECDVLITSGGISVGDYDFVGKAMEQNGVRTSFYKVKQKPGKPLFYGFNNTCHVFALPGNPASALTCTYLYVYPALQKMIGSNDPHLEMRSLQLANSYSKKPGLTHHLKGRITGNLVESLENQSSSMLNSFALSDCLIVVPEETEHLEPGDSVSVYILP